MILCNTPKTNVMSFLNNYKTRDCSCSPWPQKDQKDRYFPSLLQCIISSVFVKLIWRTICPKSFLFGTAQFYLWASGAVSYDYIVSINSLLIGSRCIINGAHTNHCWANFAHASKNLTKSLSIPVIHIMQFIVSAIITIVVYHFLQASTKYLY